MVRPVMAGPVMAGSVMAGSGIAGPGSIDLALSGSTSRRIPMRPLLRAPMTARGFSRSVLWPLLSRGTAVSVLQCAPVIAPGLT